LQQALAQAWARQPEAQARPSQLQALQARQQAAQAWTAGPGAVEAGTSTRRLNPQRGVQEVELAVSWPLWLPGERAGAQALAGAETTAWLAQWAAARLRLAGELRAAWWPWWLAAADLQAAEVQLGLARRTAADVARRVQAGDLALADQHQADAAVAAAEALLAQAQAGRVVAGQQLRALTAEAPPDTPGADQAEPEPAPAAYAGLAGLPHAELQALQARLAAAQRAASLARVQSREAPELRLATTRERGGPGEAWTPTYVLGLRLPLGGGDQHQARVAAAGAEVHSLQAQQGLLMSRLEAERHSAEARTQAARAQQVAAERRAQLALATHGLVEKAFALGEADLPSLLRVQAEAAEARRAALRAGIERAAAISAWRQALGWLPP
jgi:cobalt-zinc-cadmium efflux system outer membrane protein